MSTQHTPGSWTAAGLNQTRLPPLPLAVGALEGGQNKAICSIFGFTDEDEANACLIEVAPGAPHECEPTCPGEQNRRKLAAFDKLLEAIGYPPHLRGWADQLPHRWHCYGEGRSYESGLAAWLRNLAAIVEAKEGQVQ